MNNEPLINRLRAMSHLEKFSHSHREALREAASVIEKLSKAQGTPVAWMYDHWINDHWIDYGPRRAFSDYKLDHTFTDTSGEYVKGVPVYTVLPDSTQDTVRMDWLVRKLVEVRTPAVWGSDVLFYATELNDDEEGCEYINNLREQVDHYMAKEQE